MLPVISLVKARRAGSNMKMLIVYSAVFFAILHVARLQTCEKLCGLVDPLQPLLKLIAGSNCATDDGALVEYWLYTESGSSQITSPSDVDKTKPLKILIHGWAGSKDVDYIQAIKNAYIEKDATRYNIIVVDYGMYAEGGGFLTYATAYCNVPVVAVSVAKFLCDQYTSNGVDPKNIHEIGHSLGAHVAGIAGKLVQQQCNIVIGRITGLDPAGPGFMCPLCGTDRLDKSNADFVDVIHTNTIGYGTLLQLGDVDFYVNGGVVQPQCDAIDITAILANPTDLFRPVSCNHQRSCFLFAESILTNSFKGTCVVVVGAVPVPCTIFNKSYAYMGEYCRAEPSLDTYGVTTNDSPPYGKDPSGPMD